MKPMNNTQRKMLDEIINNSISLEKNEILKFRDQEFKELKETVRKREAQTKYISRLLEARDKFWDILKTCEDEMAEKGLMLTNLPYNKEKPLLRLAEGYNSKMHPTLQAYKDETDRIMQAIEKRRREVRMVIYGQQGTYEEIRAAAEKLLES